MPGGRKVDTAALYQTFFCTGDWGADRMQLSNKQEAKFINGKQRVQRQALEKKSGAIIELLGKYFFVYSDF